MDLDKVVPQLARVLKPGGLLVAAAWQAAERNPFWCSLVPAIARGAWPAACVCTLWQARSWVRAHWSWADKQLHDTCRRLPACLLACPSCPADIDPDLPEWSEADIAPFTATRFADPAELLAGLAAAGLRGVACRPLPITYTMAADAWWPSLLRIPDLPVKVRPAAGSGASGIRA